MSTTANDLWAAQGLVNPWAGQAARLKAAYEAKRSSGTLVATDCQTGKRVAIAPRD
jgi:hypothetical protein